MRIPLCLCVFLVAAPLDAAPPTVTTLFPAGARQGTTVEVRADGKFEPWPVDVWCGEPKVEVRPGKSRGTLQVTVADDAPPGVCWIRLYNAEGASKPVPFVVGTLPEALEKEPNDEPGKPQTFDNSSLLVNGRLAKNGDVDHFAVPLKKGQTLVAALTANEVLGSPMDGVLQVLSPEGFVLADVNDSRGLDPQIAFAVPRDGTYLVRVFAFPATPDSGIRFSGGANYVYRLTLTAGGFADHALPPAVSLKDPTPVRLVGWNIPTAAERVEARPGQPADSLLVHAPGVANPVPVRVEPHAVRPEQEPNGPDRPQEVEAPVTVGGHIDPPGDVDVYQFPARKGQKLTVQVEARALGSPLAPTLQVRDAGGKPVRQEREGGRRGRGGRGRDREVSDPELSFTAPADGTYRAEVSDLYEHGGLRYVYRLRVAPTEPDFALTVAADSFSATAGQELEIPVTVTRRDGFDGVIELSVEGLPEGAEVVGGPVKADARAKSVNLKLRADKPFGGPVRILGRTAREPMIERSARATLAEQQTDTDSLWLTVRPAKEPAKGPEKEPAKKK